MHKTETDLATWVADVIDEWLKLTGEEETEPCDFCGTRYHESYLEARAAEVMC